MEYIKILTAVILNYVHEADRLLRCYSLSVGCGFTRAEIIEYINSICDDIQNTIKSTENRVKLIAEEYKKTMPPDKHYLADNMIEYYVAAVKNIKIER